MPTVDAVLSDLKNNKYAPVYFLQGEEPFFIDQIANYIEKNALEESARGFDQVIMYGKDIRMTDVLNNARRFPMMAERQVLIIKEAQSIQDFKTDAGQKLLLDYLDNPQPSTILVFSHKYKKVDRRKALGKTIGQKAVLVDTKKMYDNQLPEWIVKHTREQGFEISDKAAFLMANYIGNDLERLSNELHKITINFQEKIKIDEGHIHKYIGISKEYNVFELQKALAYKDILKANKIINYFAANPRSNPIVMVVAVLYTFYAKVLMVHKSPDKSNKAIASKLRLPTFIAGEYATAAKNYPLGKVMNNISHLRHADLQAKGVNASNLPEDQVLKELIYNLMH